MAERRRRYTLPGARAPRRSRRRFLPLLAVLVVGIVAAAAVWFLWLRPRQQLAGGPLPSRQPSPAEGTLPPLPNPFANTGEETPPAPPRPVTVATQSLRWEGPPPDPGGVRVSTQLLARALPRNLPPAPETNAPSAGEPLRPEPGWVPRAPQGTLEIQIALHALGISSGPIDGVAGGQTESALRAFQIRQGIEATGRPDRDTLRELRLAAQPMTRMTLDAGDIARIHRIPETWLGKSRLDRLDFESVLELAAERARTHPQLLQKLNPHLDWQRIAPGTEVVIPNAFHPPARRAARVRVSLAGRYLRAYDERGRILCHFPCSIGRVAAKRPVGDLHVVVAVKDPNYTFDPRVFPESAEGRALGRKLVIPPGPNNPVGVAWIGLDRPGYGIHGTPVPEKVGRTESHGCFRLANWNAEYLRQMVWTGMPVSVEP